MPYKIDKKPLKMLLLVATVCAPTFGFLCTPQIAAAASGAATTGIVNATGVQA